MVKFQIMSDLHLEVYDETPDVSSLITPKAEYLILAGDICHVNKTQQLTHFLTSVCKMFNIVFYILGNHEFYKTADYESFSIGETLNIIKTIQSGIPNLVVLNRQNVVIEDVCLVGATLWSNPDTYVPHYIIRIKDITTDHYKSMHTIDLAYIEQCIDVNRQRELKTLVVSHHCPTYDLLDVNSTDKFKSLYASNLDRLLTKDKVHTWVFGHTHINFDYMTKGGTRLVSNQKGKPKNKVPDFLLDKVIEL